jgi:hypothetical protein
MTETWLDFCIRRPGPAWKRGYSGVLRRELLEIEGEVDHSTEGHLGGALGVLDGPSTASWTFTIDWDGTVYQHYALEDICWHCGLPGDRRFDTSLIGNITLRGIEHVDRLPNGTMLATLTPPQLATSVRISQEIRRHCPQVAANPPTLRLNMWEHNWLSATACPSGLIPWAAKFTAMEDDMWSDTEKDEVIQRLRNIDGLDDTIHSLVVDVRGLVQRAEVYVNRQGGNHVYRLTPEQTLVHVTAPEILGLEEGLIRTLPTGHPIFRLPTLYPSGTP